MKNSYLASFALPFALSSCFIIHEPRTRTGSRSLASYDKEVNGSEKSPVRLFEFSERRDREGSSTPAFSTGLFLIRSSFSLSLSFVLLKFLPQPGRAGIYLEVSREVSRSSFLICPLPFSFEGPPLPFPAPRPRSSFFPRSLFSFLSGSIERN